MRCARWLVCLMSVAICEVAAGATILIDPTTLNGSFEDAPTTKQTNWGTVTAWENWGASVGGPSTANNDSGTDLSAAASNGTHVAFLQPNNAAYNLTSYVVQAGNVFAYTWDWVLTGRGSATVQLAYQDGVGNIVPIAGTSSTNPNTTMPHLGLGASYTAMAGDPAIGRPIAITVGTTGNYPEVDNFVLNVTVPEPATLALLCLGACSAWAFGRRRAH